MATLLMEYSMVANFLVYVVRRRRSNASVSKRRGVPKLISRVHAYWCGSDTGERLKKRIVTKRGKTTLNIAERKRIIGYKDNMIKQNISAGCENIINGNAIFLSVHYFRG